MTRLQVEAGTRIYIRPGYTDMRKSALTLAEVVKVFMRLNVFEAAIFIFRGRSSRLIKILYWDRNGFCLWQKRLEEDSFPWPPADATSLEISMAELEMLLSGINFFRRHSEKYISKIF